MNEYLETVERSVHGCKHEGDCFCTLHICGVGELEGYMFDIRLNNEESGTRDMFADLTSKFRMEQGHVLSYDGDLEVDRFMSRIKPNQDFKLVSTQLRHAIFPGSVELLPPSEMMKRIFRIADAKHFEHLFRKTLTSADRRKWSSEVWIDSPPSYQMGKVPSLQNIILQKYFSIYNSAYGKSNGLPHAVSALDGLYPNKWADAVLKQIRHVHAPLPTTMIPLQGLNEAIELLYHHLGTRSKWGQLKPELTFEGLERSNLGTSAGLNNIKEYTIDGDVPLKVGGKKKLELFEADVKSILDWLTDEEAMDLYVAFNNTGKNEVFFSNTKQWNADDFAAWKHKCRLFVIPSSIFILLERMVGELRQMLERRGPICVGMKWSKGGMDVIAKKLKIDILNEWLHILVEGDVENFDQSVWERFIDLYFSFGLVYDLPEGPDYQARKRITRMLIRILLTRLTHMFGKIWGFKIGGMPSGIYNTSHGDSWIMCLWFFLFGVFQIANAPKEDKEMLEQALLWMIAIIVYGDDHVYNMTADPKVQKYFGGKIFVHFMNQHFGVKIRGLRDGISFLSTQKGGLLCHKGMTFCRQQAIMNEHRDVSPKQPRYLPFRENFEFWVRTGWGRDVRVRTPIELMLSCIGHAYGTFASNRIAYDGLFFLYETALAHSYDPKKEKFLLQEGLKGFGSADFQEFRRRGVDPSEIINGFPSWETLIKKNEYDEQYHVCDQERVPFDYEIYG